MEKRWLRILWRSAGLCVALLLISLLLMLILLRQAIPPRVEGAYFEVDGLRIHYTEEGSGSPVVLLHGLAVNADYQWRKRDFFERMSKRHRVIAMDWRGHGLSDKPRNPEAYGVRMAEDVVALLDHLEIERAHIAGYSLGGFVTLKLLSLHPERFLSAAVCGAGWEKPSPENLHDGEAVAQALEKGEGFGPLLQRLGLPEKEPTLRRQIEQFMVLNVLNDRYALAAVVRGMQHLAVPQEVLSANQVPALIMIGSKDGLRGAAEELARLMPQSTLKIIEGGNHLNTGGKAPFLEALMDFWGSPYKEKEVSASTPRLSPTPGCLCATTL